MAVVEKKKDDAEEAPNKALLAQPRKVEQQNATQQPSRLVVIPVRRIPKEQAAGEESGVKKARPIAAERTGMPKMFVSDREEADGQIVYALHTKNADALARQLDSEKEKFHPEKAAAEAYEKLAGEIRRLMTPEYLGPVISAKLDRMPPFITIRTAEFFRKYGMALDGDENLAGVHIPDSNHVLLSTYTNDRALMALHAAHEQLHYAAWLGGGYRMRWEGENGQPRFGSVSWLHEGLTELHAQQLVRDNGYAPPGVAYAPATATAFYLQKICGAETLRASYLTGNLSALQVSVDAKLGKGTFAALMEIQDPAQSRDFLAKAVDRAGLGASRLAWETDPLMRATLRSA